MICSCGGRLTDRQINDSKGLQALYTECVKCGRVEWLYRSQEFDHEARTKAMLDSIEDKRELLKNEKIES